MKNYKVYYKIYGNKIVYFLIFLSIIIIDQITKYFAERIKDSVVLIPGILNLSFVTNTGIAFGLFKGNNILMIFLYLIILGFLLFFHKEFKTRVQKICYILIFAGLIGNLIDRVIKGSVRDFLDLGWWPVFNIADSVIFISVILLIIELLIGIKKER